MLNAEQVLATLNACGYLEAHTGLVCAENVVGQRIDEISLWRQEVTYSWRAKSFQS